MVTQGSSLTNYYVYANNMSVMKNINTVDRHSSLYDNSKLYSTERGNTFNEPINHRRLVRGISTLAQELRNKAVGVGEDVRKTDAQKIGEFHIPEQLD